MNKSNTLRDVPVTSASNHSGNPGAGSSLVGHSRPQFLISEGVAPGWSTQENSTFSNLADNIENQVKGEVMPILN